MTTVCELTDFPGQPQPAADTVRPAADTGLGTVDTGLSAADTGSSAADTGRMMRGRSPYPAFLPLLLSITPQHVLSQTVRSHYFT